MTKENERIKELKKQQKRIMALLIVLMLIALPLTKVIHAEEDNSEDESLNNEIEEQDVERISVDDKGLDSEGRIVAYFGSPVIDGEIDEVWDRAEGVTPQYISGDIETTAIFRVLWDDHSLYVLAQVRDSDLSVDSPNAYEQDSVEIFLDESNDKTVDYGSDDLHFRVNYENLRTADTGDPDGFYTGTVIDDEGYSVVLRVPLNDSYDNGDVLGIELQVNDASGSSRIGTLNVFDGSGEAWRDVSVFGEVVLAGRADDSESGVNPYELHSLVDSNRELNTAVYSNTEIVEGAIQRIEEELVSNDLSQEEIDNLYDDLTNILGQLELTEEAANDKIFRPLPSEYRSVNEEQPGSIETHEYTADNPDGGSDDKKLHVYLPHGYDESDADKKYNILYLMHGGGEDENLIFGGPGEERELKRILDNMIAKGDIDPLIVVTPTFNGGKGFELFAEELVNDVIPLVETQYNTFVETAEIDDIKATRDHRAFGGFSMGSITTWNVYIHGIDYFKYYLPLCGEARVEDLSAEETAEYLANVARESDYSTNEYYLF